MPQWGYNGYVNDCKNKYWIVQRIFVRLWIEKSWDSAEMNSLLPFFWLVLNHIFLGCSIDKLKLGFNHGVLVSILLVAIFVLYLNG